MTGLNAALEAFAGVYSGSTNGKRKISAAGTKRIAAARRARWANVRGNAKVALKPNDVGVVPSQIAAAQRRRWAKVKARQ